MNQIMYRYDQDYVQSVKKKKKKKWNTPINSKTNYRLLHFDAVNFFLVISLHGVPLPKFNFFNVNTQI